MSWLWSQTLRQCLVSTHACVDSSWGYLTSLTSRWSFLVAPDKKNNHNKLIFLICFHLVTSALTCLTLFVFSLLCFCWSTSCLLTCPLLLPLSSSSCDARAVVAQGTWRCEERAVGEWRLDCRPAGACVATPWWLLGCAWWQSHSLFFFYWFIFLFPLSFCVKHRPFPSNRASREANTDQRL